jgi:hypothetical protein
LTEPVHDLVRVGLTDLRDEARPVDPHRLATVALQRASRPRFGVVGAGVAALLLLAGVVTVGGLASGGRSGPGGPPGPATAGRPADVHTLMERAALVALSSPDPELRPDRFVYTQTKSLHRRSRSAEPAPPPQWSTTEVWISVDGHRPGLMRIDGADQPLEGSVATTYKTWTIRLTGTPIRPGVEVSFADVPTDPRELLAYVQVNPLTPDEGNLPSAERWEAAYQNLWSLILDPRAPAANRAAAFRAIALLPGATIVDNVEDAAGRPGIGVATPVWWLTGEDAGALRRILVLDRTTYRYAGSNYVTTRAYRGVAAGELYQGDAVLASGVVDDVGQRP